MEDTLQQILSWFFPLMTIVLIVLAATRRQLKGKPWLLVYLAVSLVTGLLWRIPYLLAELNMLGGEFYSTFLVRFSIASQILGLVGFSFLIPYVIIAGARTSPMTDIAPPILNPRDAMDGGAQTSPTMGPMTGVAPPPVNERA